MFRNALPFVLLGIVGCSAPVSETASAGGESGLGISRHTSTIVRGTLSNAGVVELSRGFTDSSFDYQTAADAQKTGFCFVGDIATVCAQLRATSAKMLAASSRGDAHDTLDDLVCTRVSGDAVDASYTLSDDYGDAFAVKHTIARCDETPRATTIVQGSVRTNGADVSSLHDSSFDYHEQADVAKVSLCYVGPKSGVCDAVGAWGSAKVAEYEDGAHDGVDQIACAARAGSDNVDVSYHLFDDYEGDYNVTRDIGPCTAR